MNAVDHLPEATASLTQRGMPDPLALERSDACIGRQFPEGFRRPYGVDSRRRSCLWQLRSPWHGLEPSFLNRLAVLRTSAEGAVLDTVQRVSHLVEQGSSGLRLGQLLVPQLAAGALVGGVVRDPVAWLTDAGDGSLEPRLVPLAVPPAAAVSNLRPQGLEVDQWAPNAPVLETVVRTA